MDGMLRPEVIAMPPEALVADRNRITPAPNQFTHELTRPQPYYLKGLQQATPQDGEFPPGTRVVLMVYDGGTYCRVVDGQGLYAEIEYSSLRKL